MAFYDLYATDRGLEVNRETLRLLRDIRSIAEAMYRVGEGRQADVLRAQVEIGRMAEDTIRMLTMRVGMGRARFTDANICSKVGMTNTSSTVIAMTATLMMTPG